MVSSFVEHSDPIRESFLAYTTLVILASFINVTDAASMSNSPGSSPENVVCLTLRDAVVQLIYASTLRMFFDHLPRLDDLFISVIKPFT